MPIIFYKIRSIDLERESEICNKHNRSSLSSIFFFLFVPESDFGTILQPHVAANS